MRAIDRRIGLLFLLFVALLGIAVTRATYLGSFRAGSLRQAAATQQIQTVTIPAPRGTITDRNGVQLAVSEAADDVAADPYLIKNPQAAARQLAPLLSKPFATVLALVTKPHTGFVYLAHLLPGQRAAEINRLRIPGMTLIPQTKREYPRVWAASQVLGSVGWGNRGLSGLEYLYNRALRGENGVRKVVSDAIGQPISIDDVRATRPGKPVQLTIDAALQDEVEQVLAGVGAQYSPKGATAIVMDPNTGQILALANWPQDQRQRPQRGAVVRKRGPGRRLQLRARLDVQGDSPSRGRSRTEPSLRRRCSGSPPCCRSPIARSTTPSPTGTRACRLPRS